MELMKLCSQRSLCSWNKIYSVNIQLVVFHAIEVVNIIDFQVAKGVNAVETKHRSIL